MLQNYGEEHLDWLTPVKSLLDAGAPFVIIADDHVTRADDAITYDASILDWPWGNSVWAFLASFVTRDLTGDRRDGRVWNLKERIDRITALKASTIWAAEYMLRETDLGSLEEGKLADFIVIDKDYFTIPETELEKIKTLLTVIGGKVVYRSDEI